MIRKMIGVLSSIVLCLVLVTPVLAQHSYSTIEEYEKVAGGKTGSFSEAPMLRTKVAAGELPPLEERLPEDPLVVEPVKEIGKYGETLYLTDMDEPSGQYFNLYWFWETPIKQTPDAKDWYANWLKDYEHSDDYRTWTFFLRKGMRWSDGYPVTADDVMYWWEEEILPGEIFPSPTGWLSRKGVLPVGEKVDDYTVRFHYDEPFANLVQQQLMHPYGQYTRLIAPAHYLKQFNIKFNPEADELAKKEGFENWIQLYHRRASVGWHTVGGFNVVGRPTLEAWVLKDIGADYATFERNPYYWKIDTAGKQLPYIDRIEVKSIQDPETFRMSVIGGESDFALQGLAMTDIPVLLKNQEKGNYEMRFWGRISATDVAYTFYQNYTEDEVIAEILRDVRFRQALSLAINRDEINELIFFGKCIPGQATVPPGSIYYVKECWEAYAQYDPEEANRLLDEMGLRWNKEHTYRLRPDGDVLFVKIDGGIGGPEEPVTELVKGYWEAVGVKTDFGFLAGKSFQEKFFAGRSMILVGGALDMGPDSSYGGGVKKTGTISTWTRHELGQIWREEGREAALEAGAPEDLIRFMELLELEWPQAVTEEEKVEIAKEVNLLWTRVLWTIGTVGGPSPVPCVVKNYLRNVPDVGLVGFYVFDHNVTTPAQYFISR